MPATAGPRRKPDARATTRTGLALIARSASILRPAARDVWRRYPGETQHLDHRNASGGYGLSGVDVLQTGTRDPVERISVLGEPFGFVTRGRENEAVFHGDVRLDLRQAGDNVFRRLAGDFTP